MELIGRVGESFDDVTHFINEWQSPSPYIIAHTSGSTGSPKEIQLLKSDMIQSAEMTCNYLGIKPNGLMALVLSPGYIAGKMMIVRSIISGSTLWVESPSNMPLSAYNIDREIDLLAVVPSQLDYLLTQNQLNKAKNILIGGSPLSASMESKLIEAGVDSGYVTYGMTETCSHIALRRLGEKDYCALPGVEFDTDSRGCLKISCPHLSIGSLTTNDIVRLTDKTHFQWLGRYDNVINSGGIKLFPEEIEAKISQALISHQLSNISFYLTSRESSRWGEEIVMVVENAPSLDAIYNSLRQSLDAIKRPKAIINVEKLPRTSSGKIKRLPITQLNNILSSYDPQS